MINPEYTKRLAKELGKGGGGWAPWYTFYMGAGAQISTRQAGVTPGVLSMTATKVGNPFVGGALSSTAWNMLQAPGMSAVGGNLKLSPAFKDRMRDGLSATSFVSSHVVGTQGDAPGLHHTAVAQNWYMNPAYGMDRKYDPRTPYVMSELDPSIVLDPTISALGYETETTIEVSPEVRVSKNLESRLATALTARLALDTGYEIGWDWSNASTGLGASYYPVIADNDMARTVSRDPSVVINTNANDAAATKGSQSIRSFSLSQSKSMLEVTDPTKIMRSTASVAYDVMTSGASFLRMPRPHLLRLGYMEDINADVNTQFMCLYSGVSQGHNPIAAYMSGNKTPVVGIGPVKIANWYHPSMNYWGWEADSTGTVTATSTGVRSPLYMNYTIVPIRSGLPGIGSYRIEGYLKNVIEVSLTNHLPMKTMTGSPAPYFKNGVFAAKPESGDYEDQLEQINGAHLIQQPVAFPAAQEPESPWLYYISLDDNYQYHLNKQELGKAHASDEVATLPQAPIQMLVVGGKVWMLFRQSIRVFDPDTGATTKYHTGLPVAMTAIAVDRELGKIYVGHTAGVFEFTTRTRVDLDLSGIVSDARVVGDTRLRAVNGFLTWITVADDAQSSETDPNMLVWVNTKTQSYKAFNFVELTGKTDMRGANGDDTQCLWGFVASDLRSNGDLLVITNEAGPASTHNHTAIWVAMKDDGTFRRQSTRFFLWERSLGNDRFMQSTDGIRNRIHVYRIDDLHYSMLNVPYSQMRRMNSLRTYSTRSRVDARTTGYMGRGGAIGYVYATDIRIDEENLFILKDAKRQLSTKGTSNPGRDGGFTGSMAWHEYTSDGDNIGSPLGNSTDGYKLAGFNGVETRPVDLVSAVNSGCVVILNKAYTTLFAGIQSFTQLGIELEWDGTNWVHGTAGKALRSRPTHIEAKEISPWASVAFSATVPVNIAKVHKVSVFPGCIRPKSRWYLYAGDVIANSVTLQVDSTKVNIPAAVPDYSYIGIEYYRNDLMTAKLNGTALTFVPLSTSADSTGDVYSESVSTLSEGQYSVKGDAVYLHSSAIGQTLEFSYSYVKAAI